MQPRGSQSRKVYLGKSKKQHSEDKIRCKKVENSEPPITYDSHYYSYG